MDYKVFASRAGYLQITLPRRLADVLGMKRGSRVRWELAEKGRGLILRPVKPNGGE